MDGATKTSALAIVPDESAWPAIQALRKVYDSRQYQVWPPHINLIYPFAPEEDFHEIGQKIAEAIDGLGPLKLRFSCFGTFGGKVAFLRPDCAADLGLAKLRDACAAVVPGLCDTGHAFQPHLTIGQFKNASECAEFIATCTPPEIELDVSSLAMLARNTMHDAFRRPFGIRFGSGCACVELGSAVPYAPDVASKGAEALAAEAPSVRPPAEQHQKFSEALESDLALPVPGKGKRLRVVFLVDITGSMGSQIEGVRAMMRKYCEGLEGDLSDSLVQLSIMTYTENNKRGYTSHFTSTEAAALLKYVDGIRLSCPPDCPSESANGGDGEENVLHGLASMYREPDGEVRVPLDEQLLCFIITDAPPHSSKQQTAEAKNERKALLEMGMADEEGLVDMYRVLDRVMDQRNGKVIFVPLMYGSVGGSDLHFYAQAALLSGGMLLRASGSNPQELADSLTRIVEAVNQMLAFGEMAVPTISGFQALSLAGLEPAEDEGSGSRAPPTSTMEMTAALFGLLDSVQKIGGRKWTKRAKAAKASIVAASVKLLLALAKRWCVAPAGAKLEEGISELVDIVAMGMEEPDVLALRATVERILCAGEALSDPVREDVPSCLVSLETVREAVEEAAAGGFDAEDIEASMKLAMRFLMVRMVDVNFPLDRDGKPDFMDAWSAQIKRVGPSTLTAFAAMVSRDSHTGLYVDPQSREEHSACIALANPHDDFGAACFQLASATPLLDLLTTYLISGQPSVSRNIWCGCAASVLSHILQDTARHGHFSEAEWDVIRSLGASLCVHARKVASSVCKLLCEEHRLNPSDSIPKLFAAMLYAGKTSDEGAVAIKTQALWVSFFREITADRVMRHARSGNYKGEDGTARAFISSQDLIEVPANIDARVGQHPLELNEVTLRPDWLERSSGGLRKHPSFEKTWDTMKAFATMLGADFKGGVPSLLADDAMPISLSEYESIFTESLLLGKRTKRYQVVDGEHRPLEKELDLHEIVVGWLHTELAADVAAVVNARSQAAREDLKAAVWALRCSSRAECDAKLRTLSVELCGKTYRLGRVDVPELIEGLDSERMQDLGAALVLGDWTTAPSCSLRRSREAISSAFAAHPELRAEVDTALASQAVCARADGINRHGHSATNTYPGPTGWSDEYAKARNASGSGHAAYVDQMRRYTEHASQLAKKFVGSGDLGVAVMRMVAHFDDANQLTNLQQAVEILERASQQPMGMVAVSCLARMPDSRLRMRKVRRGWCERVAGKRTEVFTLM